MSRRCKYETASSLDAGILGIPSPQGVLVPMQQLNDSITSFAGDVLTNVSKLTPQFQADWALYYANWKAYYAKNHDAWDSGIGAFFGSSEIADELTTWENRLKDFRNRYTTETSAKPSQGNDTLPTPPNTTGFDPSKYTSLIVAIGALAAIVVIGPTLTRSFSHGT